MRVILVRGVSRLRRLLRGQTNFVHSGRHATSSEAYFGACHYIRVHLTHLQKVEVSHIVACSRMRGNTVIDEGGERFIAQCIEEKATAHGRRHDDELYPHGRRHDDKLYPQGCAMSRENV